MLHRRLLSQLFRARGVGLLLCSLALLAGCNVRPSTPHRHDHSLPGFGDYTGPQDGIWPPQPKGISDVRPFVSLELGGTLTEAAEAHFVNSLLRDGNVRAELGQDFVHLQTEQLTRKGEAPRNLSIFYSYSNNQTVEVAKGQGRPEVRTFAPEAYQPPEGEKEVAAAVKLARTKLIDRGHDAVKRLDGGALLAFAGEAADEGGFLDSRVLYVTFAAGPDTLPDYFAYVDLTTKTVGEHGPIN